MSYHVQLDTFSGPLDLLLYLIRRDEIDIHDIPIAHITNEYLEALRALEQLDISVGGEFLVVASMLLEIKSQLALVRHQPRASSSRPEMDPRYELVRQLLEYKRFRDASDQLKVLEREQSKRFFHPLSPQEFGPPGSAADVGPIPTGFVRADLWDLVATYSRLLNAISVQHPLRIPVDHTPIEVYYERIRAAIACYGRVRFIDLIDEDGGRSQLVSLFLALLELLRQRWVIAIQDRQGGEILLTEGPGPETFDEDDEGWAGDDLDGDDDEDDDLDEDDEDDEDDDDLDEDDDEDDEDFTPLAVEPAPPGDPSLN